jgi:hypothetical protein
MSEEENIPNQNSEEKPEDKTQSQPSNLLAGQAGVDLKPQRWKHMHIIFTRRREKISGTISLNSLCCFWLCSAVF